MAMHKRRRATMIGLIALGLVTAILAGLALTRSLRPADAGVPSTPAGAPTQPGGTVEPASTTSPLPAPGGGGAHTVAVVGDGYSMDSDWVKGLPEDWTVVNFSQRGMGYLSVPRTCTAAPCGSFQTMAQRVKEAQPDAVVLIGGDADGDHDISAAAVEAFRGLKQAAPQATIVATSPLSARSPRPYWLTLHTRSIQRGASEAGVVWLDIAPVANRAASYNGEKLTPAASRDLAKLVTRQLVA